MVSKHKASSHHELQVQRDDLAGIRAQHLARLASRRAGRREAVEQLRGGDTGVAAVSSEVVIAVRWLPGHALVEPTVACLELVADGDDDGAVHGPESGPASPGEDVERRGAGAEVEGEGPRAPRAPDQHPQDVVVADRARGAAAAVVLPAAVLADAEERAVCVSSGDGLRGNGAASLQDVHYFGCGLLQLNEQSVCCVPGHKKNQMVSVVSLD